MKTKIFIFGCGGHAKVIADVITNSKEFELQGFLLDENFLTHNQFQKFPVQEVNVLAKLKYPKVVIAIGDNYSRKLIFEKIKNINSNITFPNIIHPSCILSGQIELGIGNVFMPGSIVNADTKIGDFCIFNTASLLEHDCSIGSFSSLGPKSSVGGGSKIGQCSAISIAATVSNSVIIGDNTVIGGNSFVKTNIPSNVVAYGIPAKVIRPRKDEDKYLSA